MIPVPLSELLALLDKLRAPVNKAALTQAYARAQTVIPLTDRPQDHVRKILSDAGMKDVRLALLPWRRFDPRHLPALMWHEQTWWLAERYSEEGKTDTLTLTREGVEPRTLTVDDLVTGAPGTVADDETAVLWFSLASHVQSENLSDSENPAMRLVWRELLRDRRWVSRVVAATLLVNILAIPTSLFAMQVYDRVVPTLAWATLTTLVVGMVLVVGLDWLLKTLRARVMDSVASSVDKRLSQHVYEHLLHLQLDQQPGSLGTLAAQVGALDSVRQVVSAGLVFGIVDLPFALLFIGLIGLIGGPVGWVYLGMLPVALAIGLFTRLRLRRLTRQQMLRSNERLGLLVDSIRGAETLRASHAGWRFAQDWQTLSHSIAGYSIQQKSLSQFCTITTGSLATLAYVMGIVVGVWGVEAGYLTTGGMVACSILGGRVIGPVSQGVQYLMQWQQVREALDMVNNLLRKPTERRPGQTLLLPDRLPEHISVEKLRFAFPQSPVQQLNIPALHFHAGERVLLLGPVGGGKSTLLKVLAGLYRPGEGRVRLGDVDLWEIDPQLVSAQVGYLPQAVQLFKGTLRSNLMLAGAVSDTTLTDVTRDLALDQVAASNPLGMDMAISEGGSGLSGGQRQLVGLARVLMARPRIWLLDEPTASLDGEAEARVWKALQARLQPEDILIVATHRPMAAINFATRVLVVQEGTIVRDGTPDKLLPGLMARATGSRPTVEVMNVKTRMPEASNSAGVLNGR